MAPTTLIRELNSLKKDFEDGMGMGSVRRGKRERLADRIFEPNSCGNATKKKRKCSTQVEELIPDEDYETFLMLLADRGSDVAYIDNKWVDDRNDHSDVKVKDHDDVNENGMSVNGGGVNVNGMSVDDVDVVANGISADGGDVNVNGRSLDDGDDSIEVRSLDDGFNGGDYEDPDYRIILDKLTKGGKSCTNSRSVDDGDDDVHVNGRYADGGDENIHFTSLDDGLDDEDPQYRIFMENLRQDEKSYVLEVVGDNGKSELIKYEHEDEIPDGPDFDSPETLKKSQVKEKPDFQNTLWMGRKRERINCLKNSALPVNKEAIVSPRTVRYDLRKENRAILEDSVPRKKSSAAKKNVKVVDPGPVFNRMDGCSNNMPGLEVPCTPEAFKVSPVKKKTELRKTPNKSASLFNEEETGCSKRSRFIFRSENRNNPKDVRNLPEKESSLKKKKNVNEKAANGSTREGPFKTPPVEAVHFTEQGCANEKAAKGSTKGRPLKRPRVEDPHFAKQGCRRGLEDEDYIKFLSCLQLDDGKMVYSPPNGRPVILGDDGESSPSNRSFTLFTAVDVDSGRCVKTRDASHSQFRKGLMNILTRPYDYEEYRKLLKEATHQKPLGHNRNLRSRTITCPVEGKLAPSYLKQHIVLRRKIKAARGDRPRVLNLLRGFFYWLKNVAQDESFCPWNDSSCLKVLPPSDKKTGLTERGRQT